jgi:hypothetical protein
MKAQHDKRSKVISVCVDPTTWMELLRETPVESTLSTHCYCVLRDHVARQHLAHRYHLSHGSAA